MLFSLFFCVILGKHWRSCVVLVHKEFTFEKNEQAMDIFTWGSGLLQDCYNDKQVKWHKINAFYVAWNEQHERRRYLDIFYYVIFIINILEVFPAVFKRRIEKKNYGWMLLSGNFSVYGDIVGRALFAIVTRKLLPFFISSAIFFCH